MTFLACQVVPLCDPGIRETIIFHHNQELLQFVYAVLFDIPVGQGHDQGLSKSLESFSMSEPSELALSQSQTVRQVKSGQLKLTHIRYVAGHDEHFDLATQ